MNELRFSRNIFLLLVAALVVLAGSDKAFGQATITIVNMNAPGVGFNDTTPAAPVGGNTGTTVGQQRLIAFQHAANIWGSKLNSNVTIKIQASFTPLACTPTSAVLGAAGAIQVFANFPNAPFLNRWHHVALANKLAGVDLAPGADGTTSDDIIANFNSNLGQPGCLTGIGFYLGLDNNHGNQIDLVAVLLHEFAHGLGFSTFVNKTTGAPLAGFLDNYSKNLFDTKTGKNFDDMTNSERAASTINTRRLVWTGPYVTDAVPMVLSPGARVARVNAPSAIAGIYPIGEAAFGPAITTTGVTGALVLAQDPADGAGPSTTDGCSPLTNAAAIAGNIALIDRGTCGFVVKVKNAQDAGAIGVVIADNAAGSPPAGLGGVDPTITIPSVRVSLPDGTAFKANLPLNVTIGIDNTVRQGTAESGQALVYTPTPVVTGSSLSHWDTSATPNQLMEPSINADLTHNVEPPSDLSLPLMRDVGWLDAPTISCPKSPIQVNAEPGLCTASVSFSVTATGFPDPTIVCTRADTKQTVTSPAVFPVGSTVVNCTASNGTSPDANCSFTVTVTDNQKPVINCPPNITTKTNAPGLTSVVVNYATPSLENGLASDNCALQSVVCNPASGSTFALGQTTVTCTATDTSGNTASCTFKVTVFDVCIQKDGDAGQMLLFNSVTGEYVFCCGGLKLSGKGTATRNGNSYFLTHNASDRRISAQSSPSTSGGYKGNATLQSPVGQTKCSFIDSDHRNNNGTCSAP